MVNQIKAEWYKLTHSKVFYITGAAVLLLFFMFYNMSGGKGGFYMGFVTGYIDKMPKIEGFLGFVYVDKSNPFICEIVSSSTVFTSLLWVVLMALIVQFYLKEFQTGTVKLTIAYGINKMTFLYAKAIVILLYFGVLYYAFCIAAGFVVCSRLGVTLTGAILKALLTQTTLNFMTYIVLTFLIFFMCTLVKNTVVVSAVSIVFMYSMIFLLLATYDRATPILLKIYNHLNPMYYLWKTSSYWAGGGIVREIVIFFFAGIAILSAGIAYLFNRQETK